MKEGGFPLGKCAIPGHDTTCSSGVQEQEGEAFSEVEKECPFSQVYWVWNPYAMLDVLYGENGDISIHC